MFSSRARRALIATSAAGLLLLTGCSNGTVDGKTPKASKAQVERCQKIMDDQVAFEVSQGIQLEGATRVELDPDSMIVTDTDPFACSSDVKVTDFLTASVSVGKVDLSESKSDGSDSPVTAKQVGEFQQADLTETDPKFNAVSALVGLEQVAELYKSESKVYPQTARHFLDTAELLGAHTMYGNGEMLSYKLEIYKKKPSGVVMCVKHKKDGSWAYMGSNGKLIGFGAGDDHSKPCTKNVKALASTNSNKGDSK